MVHHFPVYQASRHLSTYTSATDPPSRHFHAAFLKEPFSLRLMEQFAMMRGKEAALAHVVHRHRACFSSLPHQKAPVIKKVGYLNETLCIAGLLAECRGRGVGLLLLSVSQSGRSCCCRRRGSPPKTGGRPELLEQGTFRGRMQEIWVVVCLLILPKLRTQQQQQQQVSRK